LDSSPQEEVLSNEEALNGKRPLWFWLLVYAAIGIVAYAAIYLAFLSGGGGGGPGY
jgi:hypothetical protein